MESVRRKHNADIMSEANAEPQTKKVKSITNNYGKCIMYRL